MHEDIGSIAESLDNIAQYLKCIAVSQGINTILACLRDDNKKLAGLVFETLPLDREADKEDIIP